MTFFFKLGESTGVTFSDGSSDDKEFKILSGKETALFTLNKAAGHKFAPVFT